MKPTSSQDGRRVQYDMEFLPLTHDRFFTSIAFYLGVGAALTGS